MPITFTDIIRPNGEPSLITGYDLNATDFATAVSDNNTATVATQTADENRFNDLPFEDNPSGTASFASADSIDQIDFNVTCRCFRGGMDLQVVLADNAGSYGGFVLATSDTDFSTLTQSFTVNSAGDPLSIGTVKGLNVNVLVASGQVGGEGAAFRLIIAEIFVKVHSSSVIPTRTIRLGSGAITLDSGKITVQ
tara:strand:- start:89 stop:670 length:582 start_codon:yes stop_codon:yes gene_type:complete